MKQKSLKWEYNINSSHAENIISYQNHFNSSFLEAQCMCDKAIKLLNIKSPYFKF